MEALTVAVGAIIGLFGIIITGVALFDGSELPRVRWQRLLLGVGLLGLWLLIWYFAPSLRG